MSPMKAFLPAVLFCFISPCGTLAGEADVVEVEITEASDGTFRFDATLSHRDTGWNHYADKWHIVAPDGSILATRTLLHPHVDEQPFTRSLSGVSIPETVTEVSIRGHDSVHGYGGAVIRKKVR